MVEQSISLQQKKWFEQLLIDLDPEKIKLKITTQSLFKRNEKEIPLNLIDENPEKIEKKAIGWFLLAIFLTACLTTCVSAWLWNPPQTGLEIKGYIIGQSALSFFVIFTWVTAFKRSFNLTLYKNKFSNYVAFAIYTNSPNKQNYENFIEALNQTIANANQKRTLGEIFTSLSTNLLVEEFSAAYLNELQRRGVNIQSLLSFLQKRAGVKEYSFPKM